MGYSPVHIKIHQNEAIDIKKEMLSSEMDLLKLIRIIRKYKIMRLREIKIKEKLKNNMNSSINNINKLEKMLPKDRIPKIEHGEEERESLKKIKTYTPKDKKKEMEDNMYDNIELELKEIQDKLKALE